MAHRNRRSVFTPDSVMAGPRSSGNVGRGARPAVDRGFLQRTTEKCEPVPACSGHRRSDGTQRLVRFAVVFEAVLEDFHAHGLALIVPLECGSGLGQTRIAPSAALLLGAGVGQLPPELARGPKSQIHVGGQVHRTIAGPLAQLALGPGLQAPSDPSK